MSMAMPITNRGDSQRSWAKNQLGNIGMNRVLTVPVGQRSCEQHNVRAIKRLRPIRRCEQVIEQQEAILPLIENAVEHVEKPPKAPPRVFVASEKLPDVRTRK